MLTVREPLRDRTRTNMEALWERRPERERFVRYCKLDEVGGNQRGPTGSGCLLLLSRSGRGGCGAVGRAAGRVCLRPSGNCTFLCRLCAKFQVSANTAPEPGSSRGRHTGGSGSFSPASFHRHLGPVPPQCPTRPEETTPLFL
ncbi:unnamed protein product [Pleuronectes platessa]|uniref:Uncharacterized protein n=1 Tax=Pleuronectes platessa TaxID=8262 RepID=A0A9N7ULC8_PLEPL|nr:unnamed protein product [Pleuronectes platessa]